MIDIVAHIPTTSAHRPDINELGVVAMNVNVLAAWRWQCPRRAPRRSTSSPLLTGRGSSRLLRRGECR